MTIVVGIDPSLTSTGIAVGGSPRSSVVPCETFEIKSKPRGKRPSDRIERYIELAGNVAVRVPSYSVVFLEGYAFGAKGRAIYDLGEFGAILRLRLWVRFAELIEVAPAQIKRYVTGKGNAKKIDVATKLATTHQRQFKSDNEADAFALWLIGQAYVGQMEPTNQIQREIIAKLREANQ